MKQAEETQSTFRSPAARASRFVERILSYAPEKPALRVLDVGCGAGEQTIELARRLPRADVTGVDISPESIRHAEEARQAYNGEASLRFVAADYWDFPSSQYDFIVSDTTLHLIPGPTEALFTKLAGELAPGGVLVMSMPYPCAYNRLLVGVRKTLRRLRGPLTDRLILAAAAALHSRVMSAELLRERVRYMYVVPERFSDSEVAGWLLAGCGVQAVDETSYPHASPGQLKHRLSVFRKCAA